MVSYAAPRYQPIGDTSSLPASPDRYGEPFGYSQSPPNQNINQPTGPWQILSELMDAAGILVNGAYQWLTTPQPQPYPSTYHGYNSPPRKHMPPPGGLVLPESQEPLSLGDCVGSTVKLSLALLTSTAACCRAIVDDNDILVNPPQTRDCYRDPVYPNFARSSLASSIVLGSHVELTIDSLSGLPTNTTIYEVEVRNGDFAARCPGFNIANLVIPLDPLNRRNVATVRVFTNPTGHHDSDIPLTPPEPLGLSQPFVSVYRVDLPLLFPERSTSDFLQDRWIYLDQNETYYTRWEQEFNRGQRPYDTPESEPATSGFRRSPSGTSSNVPGPLAVFMSRLVPAGILSVKSPRGAPMLNAPAMKFTMNLRYSGFYESNGRLLYAGLYSDDTDIEVANVFFARPDLAEVAFANNFARVDTIATTPYAHTTLYSMGDAQLKVTLDKRYGQLLLDTPEGPAVFEQVLDFVLSD